MATFRYIVRTSYKKNDGTYRVYIRITHNRMNRYIATPFHVTNEQVTRGFKIKDQIIIDALEEKIKEYRNKTNKIGFVADKLHIDDFVKLLNEEEEIDFFEFWKDYISVFKKENRMGTYTLCNSILNSLTRFNNNNPLYISQITPTFCLKYYESLRNLSNNTKITYINNFKQIYKQAQKKYNNSYTGEIKVPYGVFDLIQLPQMEFSKDNVIKTIEDMQAIIDVPYTGTWSYDFAKDMYILSFCCLGTNLEDLFSLTKENYKDGILSYRRKKTARRSGTSVDMKIKVPEVAKIILEKYSNDEHYLISTNGHARNKRTIITYIHHTFIKAGVEELTPQKTNIGRNKREHTFYSCRHTMASFARNICGIEFMTVHEMLNHVTPSLFKTTDAYLWKDFSAIWEANEKLLSLFDWSFYINQKK